MTFCWLHNIVTPHFGCLTIFHIIIIKKEKRKLYKLHNFPHHYFFNLTYYFVYLFKFLKNPKTLQQCNNFPHHYFFNLTYYFVYLFKFFKNPKTLQQCNTQKLKSPTTNVKPKTSKTLCKPKSLNNTKNRCKKIKNKK